MGTAFRPHVLVVDDDASVREALLVALNSEYEVHTAATGAEACALLRRHPVAVVILDALLGKEHGLDLVGRFQRLSLAPIVLLTGHGSEALAIRALRAKVQEYLKKPISLPDLLAVLDRLLPKAQHASDRVARIRRHLDEHHDKRIRFGELAARFGFTEPHLRRLFRTVYGKTPRQYLAEIRVRRAADRLRRDGCGVKEAALEAGFTDLRLFRRTFTGLMGMTPGAWRRHRR
jgi:YesN/AraC family two-component response regulator